ncbi:hypothetical protein [Paenibacillus flagellatus]|uniref:Uncharacterized protein n=1 Tax=Paenibacillus flagellatus TaxID=2211139 RepID=A0A2V5KL06_9BACL|nr:hypothetical protein [Paenibacillus flagellatus]PYI51407.1 hypothetical protein DLM86_25660 [Paenibacillus flagellatus]
MGDMTLFGYNPRKVKAYMDRLEEEADLLERRQREMSDAFSAAQAELLRQIGEAERQLAEIESMEAGLKKWIRRNRG